MKIVPIWVFHHNLLSTLKPWLICCFKSHQIILVFTITYLTLLFHPEATICSFLCLFCMCVLLYIVFPFLFPNLYSYVLQTQFFIMDGFHKCLMSMVQMLIKSLVFAKVLARTLTLGNINHLFPIHHLSPNHDIIDIMLSTCMMILSSVIACSPCFLSLLSSF